MKIKLNVTFLFVLIASALMAQTITLSPEQGAQDSYLYVAISGTGTNFQSGTSTCGPLENADIVIEQGAASISPIDITVIADDYLNTLLFIPPSLPTGTYDVQIWEDQGPGCAVSCTGCFTVTEEGFILNVDPNLAGTGEDLKVTISGGNTVWNQGTSCMVQSSNIVFSQGTATSFTPDFIEIISNDTICAWITVPDDAALGDYDVAVNAYDFCALVCEGCFEVYEGPSPLIISGGSGVVGLGLTTLNLGLSTGTYEVCDLNVDNVFLSLNGNIIYPNSVTIENDELIVVFDLTEGTLPGNYDIVIGDGLEYGCNFVCEGCFQVDLPVNVFDVPNIDLDVYPNPFDNQFGLYSASVLEEVTISLYSMTGKLIYQEQMDQLDSKNIEMADLPKGVYCLKVTCSQGEVSKRLVRQ